MKGKLLLKSVFSRPIAFHPILARITKSVPAALMLSQAIYWSDTLDDEREGWFHKTRDEWELETCLTHEQQEIARKRLKSMDLLIDERRGLDPTRWFRVNFDVMQNLLDQYSEEKSTAFSTEFSSEPSFTVHENRESRFTRTGKDGALNRETRRSYKEAETTTETTQRLLTESGISGSSEQPDPAKQKAHAVNSQEQPQKQNPGLPPSQRDSWDFRRWKQEMDARMQGEEYRLRNLPWQERQQTGEKITPEKWVELARLSAYHVGITIERLQELLRQTKLFEEKRIEALRETSDTPLFAMSV